MWKSPGERWGELNTKRKEGSKEKLSEGAIEISQAEFHPKSRPRPRDGDAKGLYCDGEMPSPFSRGGGGGGGLNCRKTAV